MGNYAQEVRRGQSASDAGRPGESLLSALRVVVAGATGRTGSAVTRTLCEAPDIEVVGAVGRTKVGLDVLQILGVGAPGLKISNDLPRTLETSRPHVVVDFTSPRVAVKHSLTALDKGIAVVVGTTGIDPDGLLAIGKMAERRGVAAILLPNFALGALLLVRIAREAAEYFQECEIIDMCRPEKVDAPSGTALWLRNALCARTGRVSFPIHSVRLPGLVSHHEVILGRPGETLTLRHDVVSFDVFGHGVLLAVRRAPHVRGLITDLEGLVDNGVT